MNQVTLSRFWYGCDNGMTDFVVSRSRWKFWSYLRVYQPQIKRKKIYTITYSVCFFLYMIRNKNSKSISCVRRFISILVQCLSFHVRCVFPNPPTPSKIPFRKLKPVAKYCISKRNNNRKGRSSFFSRKEFTVGSCVSGGGRGQIEILKFENSCLHGNAGQTFKPRRKI